MLKPTPNPKRERRASFSHGNNIACCTAIKLQSLPMN